MIKSPCKHAIAQSMLTPNYSQSVQQIRRSAKNSDKNEIESTAYSPLTVDYTSYIKMLNVHC